MSKKQYLFVDDYGAGGVWVYINALNPSDVTKKYPGLKHVSSKPEWLVTHERTNKIPVYDVEENPEMLEYLSMRDS